MFLSAIELLGYGYNVIMFLVISFFILYIRDNKIEKIFNLIIQSRSTNENVRY